MQAESLPTYSVKELNEAIGSLLSRGFAPRFILNATVSKCQLKRGHLWMTFTDGNSSIDGVVWSSKLSQLKYQPTQEDGVLVIGKLNFWEAQARLNINVIDIRPSISTVLRKFEVVRNLLMKDGLIDEQRRRPLPSFPRAVAIFTSVPSSALADMLRTGKERWPLTKLFIFPIPVQGEATKQIVSTLQKLSKTYTKLGIEALVLARGGGSREDLMVFDNEEISREVANFPIPVITGIGHEDDLTVVDLVSDHRAATPTAAIVDLLPSRKLALIEYKQKKERLSDHFKWFIRNQKNHILEKLNTLKSNSPTVLISRYNTELQQRIKLLNAFSPDNWLRRGFCIARNTSGQLITSVNEVDSNQVLNVEFIDGIVDTTIKKVYDKRNIQ